MRFTSVARFQGQQAAAVILVDLDLSDGPDLAARRRTAFLGMTRASMRLEVVKMY
jgi:superfamily I DNA and RNA helicase